jgi:hypothetical protein
MKLSARLTGTKILTVSVVLSALLTQPSYAQPFPESSRQRAQEERRKEDKRMRLTKP